MSMNPYEMFSTDDDVEKTGITLNYGSFWLVVARAGGANRKFATTFEATLRPYRRQIDTGVMDEKVSKKLLAEIYAKAVIRSWGSEEHGEGKMPGPDGKPMDFTQENVAKFLSDLPELFMDVQAQCTKVANFKKLEQETDAKN